jgi:hypothetical protein
VLPFPARVWQAPLVLAPVWQASRALALDGQLRGRGEPLQGQVARLQDQDAQAFVLAELRLGRVCPLAGALQGLPAWRQV